MRSQLFACSTAWNIFFGFDGNSLLAFGHQLTHLLPRSCSATASIAFTVLSAVAAVVDANTLLLTCGSVGMRPTHVFCVRRCLAVLLWTRSSVCWDYHCCYSLLLLLLRSSVFFLIHVRRFVRPVCVRLMFWLAPSSPPPPPSLTLRRSLFVHMARSRWSLACRLACCVLRFGIMMQVFVAVNIQSPANVRTRSILSTCPHIIF